MNKVILMGRLTKDPELRQSQNGISVARFTIAVNRRFALTALLGVRQANLSQNTLKKVV